MTSAERLSNNVQILKWIRCGKGWVSNLASRQVSAFDKLRNRMTPLQPLEGVEGGGGGGEETI